MSLGSKKGCMRYTFAVHRTASTWTSPPATEAKEGKIFPISATVKWLKLRYSWFYLGLEAWEGDAKTQQQFEVNGERGGCQGENPRWHGSTCPHSFEALQEIFVMANKKGNYFWENLMLQYDFPSLIYLKGSFCFLILWDFTGIRR